jgi:lipoate-protein ligase A
MASVDLIVRPGGGMATSTWRVIADDGAREPRRNLALDEALGRLAGPRPTLRLWRNARCVVVGRSQVTEAEVDAAACRALGVPVYRRFTGGGAVYHDPGDLNATVVIRRDHPLLAERPGPGRLSDLYRLVLGPIAAAARALGPQAVATDRDVLVDGRKIGGVAAWIGRDVVLVHGTLLVDADLATLGRVLDGPGAPGDPRWERTKSRRVPVTSLAREGASPDVTVPHSVDAAVVVAVTGDGGRPAPVTAEEAALAEQLLESRYGRPSWHETGTP